MHWVTYSEFTLSRISPTAFIIHITYFYSRKSLFISLPLSERERWLGYTIRMCVCVQTFSGRIVKEEESRVDKRVSSLREHTTVSNQALETSPSAPQKHIHPGQGLH